MAYPNDTSDIPLKLDDFLPYQLSVLSNRISKAIAGYYEDRFALSLPQWRVMAVLGQTPDLSASQVAERTAMDKVAVSRAVKQLLADARLERHFSANDKRRSVLALSNKGWEIYREIVPLALDFQTTLIQSVTPQDLSNFRNMLEQLGTKLEDITRAGK